MRYAVSGDYGFLRLSDGEKLHDSLVFACDEYAIDSAVIVGGLGMARNVTFGWFTGNEYIKEKLDGVFELTGLSGNISYRENSLYPHLHAVLNDRSHRAFSGHILNAEADHNLEVVFSPLASLRLRREFDGWFDAIAPERR
ncbi:MAG: PPC domain-containing DNA-binding protein [Synergistota bacterium]|nr:PPC domain-containing DNA-binding protein [Synergistota bacterium]